VEDRHVSQVIYLYGFAPATAPPPPTGLAGMADSPVELLPMGPACAVIGRLPAGTWGATQVESRLEDLAWVGEQGLAHERVVLWFVDHAEILPARLFSLYSHEAALRAAFEPRIDTVAGQLRHFGGRREWNLKAAYDPAELGRHGSEVSDELRRMDDEIAAAPPGRQYLLQRRRADVLKREVARSARRMADELVDALRPLAEAVRALPLAAADAGGTVIMSAALLVTRSGEAGLRAEAEPRIARLTELGMRITLSGPWAPYRFMDAGDDALDSGTHVPSVPAEAPGGDANA
jgi:hypothetical protein